ncbi:MAG: type III secretion system gatekeeper subunit SctW [Burkholderiaceae bacterium]|nr:type III secretion system gatekeeper subunit SctW [Burkholderiaceae bacterium]
MNRIDSAGLMNSTSLGQPMGSQRGRPQTGIMMGQEAVVVSAEVSSLTDAAEELSLHMAEKTEQKHHSERKVKSDRPVELMEVDDILESMQNSQDGDAQAKLDTLIGKLMSGQGSPRQAASETFSDITQQYLGLQYALHKGEEEGAPAELLESIRDALSDLEVESGPRIRAGLNALSSAATFAPDAQGVERFLGTYRDIVLGESSLSKTLGMALENFGGQDIARGLEQLVAALGQDLAATRPSTEPARLQALTSDLYQLQIAVTVLEGGHELAATLQSKNLARVEPELLMRDLVGLTGESWISEARFTTMARQHGADSAEGRVAFLSGTKAMLRELPVPVFPDADTRQAHLNAVQDALDIAIDEEEQQ